MDKNTQPKKSLAAEREEKILAFWRENNTFEKSLTKDAPKGNYVFYDGPPFATGLPHYGHILGSTAKDVIGRYQTMQGFRVPRRWGWDCHGLPIENIVEKDLGVSGHVEIEALGVEKFVEHARSKVLTYVHDWKKTVERIGRWVDFDGGYKTMDNTFIESVWWALGKMNDDNLLYEGVRVLAYCPRCETPIAKSEIAMDNSYKDITDISVYVRFPFVDEPKTNLIAWTTTPWSLPGNIAIAIGPKIEYFKFKVGELTNYKDGFDLIPGETYIMSALFAEKVLHTSVLDKNFKREFTSEDQEKGSPFVIFGKLGGEQTQINLASYSFVTAKDLVGKKYTPPFDYYTKGEALLANPKSWTVVAADFVTTTDGTGIAHEAPAFGEDDANLAQKENIPFIIHVTPEGRFAPEVTDFAGMQIKPKSAEKDGHMKADIEILKYLQAHGSLFKKEKIVHPYPHCYRCDTPLFYYALPSWFINIQKSKLRMLETAKSMEWVPAHLKDGRFKNTMEAAPDWNISRNRYWASPLPFWKSKTGKYLFVNSREDLKKKTKSSGNTYFMMRHGEATNNVAEIFKSGTHASDGLTEKGRKEVEESAAEFSEKIDVVIVSPYLRTRETAEIICKKIGFPTEKIIYEDRIKEWEVSSDFDGRPYSEMKQYYVSDYAKTPDKNFSDGESFVQMVKRIGDFMYDLESKYQGKNILLVGHDGAGRGLQFVTEGYRFDDLARMDPPLRHFKNAEIRKMSFVPLPHNAQYELDLHRPYIDAITLVDEEGEEYQRITEVIDCWFESGSMPFAQDHYPFERPNWHKENFPAGFVAEYIAQTRTWFYYTHAISTILFDGAPFEHVVTTGTLLAEDGQKMSKSKNNFPDPWVLFDKYGVDPLRLYLMSSTLMKGEDTNFSEKTVQDIASKIIGRLLNVVSFFEIYANEPVVEATADSGSILDYWIGKRFEELLDQVTAAMEKYDMTEATRPLELFVDDLSTWYLRRSRDRIKDGDPVSKDVLYWILKTFAQLLAPFIPFTAEAIWQDLKADYDVESVHLTSWPIYHFLADDSPKYEKCMEKMKTARSIVTLGMQARQKKGIPVRQPLQKLTVKSLGLEGEYIEIIKDELNVKELREDASLESEMELDTKITVELKREGSYRELIRAVQDTRKKEGLTPSDVISLSLSANLKETVSGFETEMKKTVLAKEIMFDATEGETVSIDGTDVFVQIKK